MRWCRIKRFVSGKDKLASESTEGALRWTWPSFASWPAKWTQAKRRACRIHQAPPRQGDGGSVALTQRHGSMWSKCDDDKADVLSCTFGLMKFFTERLRRPRIPINSSHVFPWKWFPIVHQMMFCQSLPLNVPNDGSFITSQGTVVHGQIDLAVKKDSFIYPA